MRLKIPTALRRFPFTIGIVLIVAVVGLTTASHVDTLHPTLLERFGIAPSHLPQGELWRLATSVFLTHGGTAFYLSLAMLAACVGLAEKRVGTWKAMLAFWGIHLATLLVQSLLLAIPLGRLNLFWFKLLAIEHDVGPSAGYYGCLGLVCQKQSPKRRSLLLSIVGGILIARAVWSALAPHSGPSHLSADLAHLIAFPLGVALAKRM
jgi:membrane associated rhomboid family serine protease